MAYCTQSDIELVLPATTVAELTDDVSGVTTNASAVTRAISDADSIIDSFARGKHTLPFSPVPDNVRRWSVSLAIHKLYTRRLGLRVPEAIKTDYDGVIVELKALRDNKIVIDDPNSSANTASYYKSNGRGNKKKEMFSVNSSGTGTLDEYYAGP